MHKGRMYFFSFNSLSAIFIQRPNISKITEKITSIKVYISKKKWADG